MADGSSGNLGGVLFEAGQSAVKATAGQVKAGVQTTAQGVVNDTTSALFGKPLGVKPQNTTPFPFPQKTPGQFPKLPGQMPKLDAFGGMFEKGMGGKGFGPTAAEKQAELQRQQAELKQMDEQNKAQDAQKIAALTKKLHDEIYYNKIKNAGGSLQEDWAKKQKQEQDDEEAKKQAMAQSQAAQGPVQIGSFGPGKDLSAPVRPGGVGNQQLVRQGAHEAVKTSQ